MLRGWSHVVVVVGGRPRVPSGASFSGRVAVLDGGYR